MKRDKKYYKEIPKETLMNRLRHIVLLGIGIFSSVLFSQPGRATEPQTNWSYDQSTQQAFYIFDDITIDGLVVEGDGGGIDNGACYTSGNCDVIGAFRRGVCSNPANQFNEQLCVVLGDTWNIDEEICIGWVYANSAGGTTVPLMGKEGVEGDNTFLYANGGDVPYLKVYDSSNGSILDLVPSAELPGWVPLMIETIVGTSTAGNAFDCDDGMVYIEYLSSEGPICVPTDFSTTNQSTLQAFYYFNSVAIDGIEVESNDWVGAFNGNICVGARKWDTSLCGNGVCDLPVMGDDGSESTAGYMNPGDFPTFKIYDASENSYFDAASVNEEAWESNNWSTPTNLNGEIWGCTNSEACNYDPSATVDDDSCLENDCAGECGGSAVEDECGVCGGSGIPDGACGCDGNVEDCAGECGGSSVLDECGVCNGDNSSCSGCIDYLATNFDPAALVSDGSCNYPVYGCMDYNALNYDADATNSNGGCDYPPEVGIWFGNIDADAGTMEIYSSSDSDLDNISFSISGATITESSEGSVSGNTFTLSGTLNEGFGLLTTLSFTGSSSEFCITFGSANAIEDNPVNLTLGGCSVFVGIDGGEVASETGGVDIPEGALSESQNISVGEVTEELPEEVDNATGFDVEEIVSFTPFDLVFEVPVAITVSSSSSARDDEYLCYLEDANDTEWAVVDGANCTDGTCTADVTEFGIFATCILVEDCNGDFGGFAYNDDCNECVGGNTGNEANDAMDECGLCGGPGYIDWYIDADGDNLGYGDGVPFCSDVVPDGYVPNNDDSEPNCATNDTDECGLCGGDGPADGYNCEGNCIAGYDCEGICGGNSIEDECDVCGGNDNDGNETCDIVCEGTVDCAGECNGNAVDDDCGVCNGSNTCAGCNGIANSNVVVDECGECGGDGIDEGACDCDGNEADCMGVCGGSAELDECDVCNGPGPSTWYIDADGDNLGFGNGVEFCSDSVPDGYVPNDDDEYPDCGDNYYDCAGECGGSSSLSGCDNVCGSTAEYDNCGACDNDPSNDCQGEYDNCGVWNGNNSDCWFIDITTSIGYLAIEDSLSRIGMHEAAEDDFNAENIPGYTCGNCYKDELEIEFNNPSNWIDFYFPHPEWVDDIHDYIFNGRTDLKKDIRHLEPFTVADLDFNSSITVDGKIYYAQQIWDLMIDTDQNISSLPFGEDNVKLEFNFVNQIPNSEDFTKIFFYKDNNGNAEIEEITPYGGSSDPSCLSDFCIVLDDFELLTNLKIILGTDTVQPSATITSPIPNEIFALEDYNFQIELDIDNLIMIEHLEFYFEVDGSTSPVIPVEPASFVSIYKNDYYDFLDGLIDGNYIENVNLHVEIIDIAGGSVNNHPNGEYHHVMGPLTFSRNTSTTELETGWHLLAPPLAGNHDFVNMFTNPTFDCSDGCTIVETANSGNGFYVKSNGESAIFSGEVLPEFNFNTTLEQGWNLTGNPLVNEVDINSVIITYNNFDYNWPDAAKYGIISPTPIIYDNESGGHIGTSELSTAAGFWVHSFYNDVEISFIPSNPVQEIEASNYWNLSLFAKENNPGIFDESIGSEIVIGIHENANNTMVDGEDQEIFPLSSISILDNYNELSINNNGTSSIYRDIRSYHETSITWDLEGKSIQPFDMTLGVYFTWEFSGNDYPYDYFLDIGEGTPVNMKEVSGADVTHNHFLEEMSITAVLKEEYIGCTHPLADNYNKLPDSNEFCEGGTCLGGNQSEYCNILSLSLPESFSIDPDLMDQAFDLPISLTNPQGIPIDGLQFNLEYDAEMIQLNNVTLNENLENYYIFQQINTNSIPAELSVTIYYNGTGELISGEGGIMTLSGNGLENAGTTSITFNSVQINENANAFGNNCEISIGLVYLNVSGEIIYYYNGLPVSGGNIRITEIDNTSNINATVSNEDGNFIIESLVGDKFYELLISKDEYGGNLENYFDGLSAVDASRIARHSVGLYNFTEKDKLAANVNFDYRCEYESGNPTGENESDCQSSQNVWAPNIEAGDASKVAKYAAGIIEDLNNQCDPHWIFINPEMDLMIDNQTCEDIPYEINLESSISDLVFEGIRLGDVTGNWTAPLGRKNDDNFVENPTIEVEVGQIIKLPIYLPNKAEIEGLDLTIQYDPEVFKLIGFNDNNSILEKSKYPTVINTEKTGLFTLVSYANSTPINDNGLLGNFKFEVISNSARWTSISINEMKINDIQEGGFLVEGNFESSSIAYGFDFQISAVPDVFALNKNYPNPFNPTTNIQFELSNDGEVQIFIYDIKGSLVDELVNGYMEAGYHKLKWDGSHQASGMYFIRMIADNGNYIKMSKMMLVK